MTEFRPRGFFHIPPVIKNIIIINLLVFLAQISLGDRIATEILNRFALHDISSHYFHPMQLVTYLFLHGSWGHVLMNMFVLWMFGSILEDYWGPKRFLVFYIVFISKIGDLKYGFVSNGALFYSKLKEFILR